MRHVLQRVRFRREYKLQRRRGKKTDKLEEAVRLLIRDGNLPAKYQPHQLSGEFDGYWECHIESDWLLIYAVTDREVLLVRTGAHADLFE